MKLPLLFGVSALALTAAACAPRALPARAALECPATEGDLTRTAVAADGKTCVYTTREGSEVTLQLVSAPGGADAALSSIETTLLANRTAANAEDAAKNSDAKADAAEAAADAASEAADAAATVSASASVGDKISARVAARAAEKAQAAAGKAQSAADRAAAEAAGDAADVDVDIQIGKHGRHVSSKDSHGNTTVNLPGIHIVANEGDDTANVKVGPITVNAGGDGATIRMRRDVRLRGEALNPEKRGLRATFIYAGGDLPGGYRFVGYEAGGPKAGPIAVAVVKSKVEESGGDIYPDVKKLVRKNGGV